MVVQTYLGLLSAYPVEQMLRLTDIKKRHAKSVRFS
ncbi:MAG: hypothetical protein RLY31_3179 [Bacteroidota bacterium]